MHKLRTTFGLGKMPQVLDPCCGSRMMWFDRQNPNAIFGDQRNEVITVTDRSHGHIDGQRLLRIEPDVQLEFRDMPFPDGAFKMVVFDPPHLENAKRKFSNWNTPRLIECFEHAPGVLSFPRGFTSQALRIVTENRELFSFTSKRRTLPDVDFQFIGTLLKPFQQEAVAAVLQKDFGTLQDACYDYIKRLKAEREAKTGVKIPPIMGGRDPKWKPKSIK